MSGVGVGVDSGLGLGLGPGLGVACACEGRHRAAPLGAALGVDVREELGLHVVGVVSK